MFTTQLVTRLVVFLVVWAAGRRASCSPALALAYRTRPVFVPTSGPNDPVARYRTAVMTRLRLVGIGIPAVIGFFAGIVAQTYWERIQLFLHGGSFGIADPQFGMDLGFYAFDLPFYRLVLGYLFVATFLALIANLLGHYLFGGIRLSGRTGALSRSARIQLISLVGTPGAAQGDSPTGWTATSCCRTPAAASRSPAPATPTSTRCCPPS